MSSSKIENLVRHEFNEFYRARSLKLSNVSLSDLLREKNLFLLCATHDSSVSKIFEHLLAEYLAPFDAHFFGQTFLESLTTAESQDTKLVSAKSQIAYEAIALINLTRNYSTPNRREFDRTQAKTLNRLDHDFLNNFGNPDGSIDWEKLLQYNCGKENVPWVSKVMPASVEDQEDDEVDDTDEGVESNG